MTTGLRATIENQVLRLQIDLEVRPGLQAFSGAVEDLATFASYAALLSGLYLDPEDPFIDSSLGDYVVIVKTSLASPWVTILAEAAGRTPPVAYTLTAVYCLQRVLRLIIEWQNHRDSLDDRRMRRELERLEADIEAERERMRPVKIRDYTRTAQMRDLRLRVFDIAREFPHIDSAELLDENDPRAGGA